MLGKEDQYARENAGCAESERRRRRTRGLQVGQELFSSDRDSSVDECDGGNMQAVQILTSLKNRTYIKRALRCSRVLITLPLNLLRVR
jgi:hypothetical protein